MTSDADALRWAAGGGMWLTGPDDGPGLGPPAPLLPLLDSLVTRIAATSAVVGAEVRLDPMVALTERAAWAGLGRWGRRSCGGATRLLPTIDGWVAITIARPTDVEMVPALVEQQVGDDPWPTVTDWCARHPMRSIAERAELLALPAGALGERSATDAMVRNELERGSSAETSRSRLKVVDLSAMWAGPLCGAILAAAGCDVVKVESTTRPDGARLGPKGFFRRLHDAKQMVALPFDDASGRAELIALIAASDVVIEASRTRALRQLGVDRTGLHATGPTVWVTITGHGAERNRVGFGDDAAVAGGLVVWDRDQPYFAADAVADPLSGLFAAAETLEALVADRRVHLDVAIGRGGSLGRRADPRRATGRDGGATGRLASRPCSWRSATVPPRCTRPPT